MTVSEYEINTGRGVGKTFVFVSDLHGCGNGPVIEKIQTSGADAVLVGGDYIHDAKTYESGFGFLRASAKLMPTFCSLGNHEFRFEGDVRGKTVKTGAVLLDDSDTEFEGVRIGGLSSGFQNAKQSRFAKTPPPDTGFLKRFAEKDGYKILLSHHPEYYKEYIRPLDIDLTLSGHAHGGQWRFFGCGVFAPGQGVFPEFTSGFHENRFIISRGFGNPHIIPRINNEPELVIIKLI